MAYMIAQRPFLTSLVYRVINPLFISSSDASTRHAAVLLFSVGTKPRQGRSSSRSTHELRQMERRVTVLNNFMVEVFVYALLRISRL